MPGLVDLGEKHRKAKSPQIGDRLVLDREQLGLLIDALIDQGYDVIAPRVLDGAVIYDRITSLNELPCGWTDQQAEGRYRLTKSPDEALFGYAASPQSWKKFLYPPLQRLLKSDRLARGFSSTSEDAPHQKYAFLGVRSCDLHAMALHDRIFLGGQYVDPGYKSQRESALIIAVNCGQAGGTCFCASMNTGPKAACGYDLALTELPAADEFRYLVEVGSGRGVQILVNIPHKSASGVDLEAADKLLTNATAHMGRSVETDGLRELLYCTPEHPMWDSIAERCLSCANCTMVCPTCFCTTVEDTTDLTGAHAERWRRWDSCFTSDFSYIHGGSIRSSVKSRFRQWMTHKLAAWIDQYGESGCVGCGRCITWCPVGIDITEEARALRESDMTGPGDFSRSFHDSSNP
jgi:ferredoxin